MSLNPQIHSLATALPPYRLDQAAVAQLAQSLFADRPSTIARMLPVFENAGIHTRYSCVPIDWYAQPSAWKARNDLYLDNALDLIESAAQDCLNAAGLAADQIDSLVVVSTTGVATPSLDARLMERMAFRADTERLPIFGLGCAGGVLGLGRAAALARAKPGSRVLLLLVELCGLTFRADDKSKSNIVATALFGDGAAALLLSCDDAPHQGSSAPLFVQTWGEHRWPNSLDVMGWRLEDDGLGVLFSRDIPTILRDDYRPIVEGFLAKQSLGLKDINGFICHPGGTKVVQALEAVLGLPEGGLVEARQVLRDYGNMSAVSVIFVLEKMWQKGLSGRHLMTSLGPGFTAGFCLLDNDKEALP